MNFLPFLPFIFGSAALAFAGFQQHQKQKRQPAVTAEEEDVEALPAEKPIGDILEVDDVHVEFAADLVNMVLDPGTGLDARIANMRNHVASVFGLILPEIRLTDNVALPNGTYVIKIQGVEQVRSKLHPDQILALIPDDKAKLPDGEDTQEPVYGAPARWINSKQQEQAALEGLTLVSPAEVLATHLLETVKQNFSRLLTLKSLRRLLSEMTNISNPTRSEANRKLLDELIPDKVPVDVLHSVLKLLLAEQVSIRHPALALVINVLQQFHPLDCAGDSSRVEGVHLDSRYRSTACADEAVGKKCRGT